MKSIYQALFFDKSVHLKPVKDAISGKNEEKIINCLTDWGYQLGSDYVRQHPIASRYVCDFAFINEQVCIEVDGINHRNKKQQIIDNERDLFFRQNGWVVVRIFDRDFDENPTFYRHLIREVVEERRKLYDTYKLAPSNI